MKIGVKRAQNQLPHLIQRAAGGEEIIIIRRGVPLARLIAVEAKTIPRKLGIDRDKIWIADDFDAPLPADLSIGPVSRRRPISPKRKKN